MISIIVGIYNVAFFLAEKQLGCIFNQTYQDWELLLVDDGSTDESGVLCDDLASRDNRITVIHKENGGLGSARNAGLDIAKGEYIWFYDVDDEAHSNLLEYAVSEMESRQLDMLQFGFKAITPDFHQEEVVQLSERMIESQDQLRENYLNDILFVRVGNGFAWNKIVRRSLIERYQLRFEDQRIQQDEAFNLKLYPLIKRLYLSPAILYDYYIYENGNTRSRFIPNRFDIYVSVREHFEELRKLWSIEDLRFNEYLQHRFWEGVDQTLRYNLLHPECPWSKNEKKEEFERVMNHPYTIEAIRGEKEKMNFESRAYLHAFMRYSLLELKCVTWGFKKLRALWHLI